MKGPNRLCCLLSALALGAVAWGILATPGTASARALKRSPDGVWAVRTAAPGVPKGSAFSLDARALARILSSAPSESAGAGVRRPVLSLPLPGGGFSRFRIERSPIMSPALEKRYRSIKTYRGQGVDDTSATARLDVTPLGFHAQILSPKGTILIDPTAGVYRSVSTAGLTSAPFACGADATAPDLALAPAATHPSGDRLRTYDLAVTATHEFTVDSGGTAAARARIFTMVNRALGIYENEVAVRFHLLEPVIFFDPADDPFPTGAVVDSALLAQNQSVLDSPKYHVNGNYDIGHILTIGAAGGLARIGGTCDQFLKAQGGTSLTPAAGPFAVGAFAHVIGHQLGAHHTFNGTTGACGDLDGFSVAQRHAPTAYEPGSGSTLMSLAGQCGDGNVDENVDENVQPAADVYFHTASFDEITSFRDDPLRGAACGTETTTTNAAPLVDAGLDYTIPQGTPFILTAAGSDPNGDPLTFCWEQFDLGAPSPPPNTVDGPLFRSFSPATSPARTFPAMADLLADVTSPWEQLPAAARPLTFRVTARDNRAGGGGVGHDEVTLTVSAEPLPFAVTAPVSGASLECGDAATLTWQVGGGSVAANVRALLSTDSGATFADELFASAPNEPGTAPFTVPKKNDLPAAARIKLEALDNIFFALSGPLTIDDTRAPEVKAPADLPAVECTSPAGAPVADLGTAVVTELCDETPTLVNDAPKPPDVFPLTVPPTIVPVTWTATDEKGNSGTATQLVTVVDTTPPSIEAPADITAECAQTGGTMVPDLGVPTVRDVCDASVTVTSNAPAPPFFPLGTTTVLWTAADDSGNTAGDEQKVLIVDTTPPRLAVSLSPAVLWPPNHKLITIRATITVLDVCDAVPTVRLVSITSNEPDNGKGDGNTSGDIVGAAIGTDDREFELRAERSGGGTGRVYTVTYEARDASGNTTRRMATVTVPHDQGK